MPAFEHEGPFVFQLKSSLALGRGEARAGGGFCRLARSWDQRRGPNLQWGTAFRIRPQTCLPAAEEGSHTGGQGQVFFESRDDFFI